jgi:hypothetical protein
MECPNCGEPIETPAHEGGCLLGTLFHVLQDRGHDLSTVDIGKVDADALWSSFGAPAADQVAEEVGLSAYPKEADMQAARAGTGDGDGR